MKKKKIIIITVILCIIITGAYYVYTLSSNSNKDLNTTTAIMGNINKNLEENGEILSININSFYSDGMKKVEKVYVQIGDEVKKGDTILTFESTLDLEIEKINKEIEIVKLNFNEAEKGTDFETINNVKLQIEGLKSNIKLATEDFDKTKIMFDEGVITKSEYDISENNVIQLENQLSILNNQYNSLTKNVSSNVKKQYEAQIESLAISLNILEKSRDNYYIIANFDGVITELNAYNSVTPFAGTLIVEIQDMNSLAVYSDFLVDEAAQIKQNMAAIIKNLDLGLIIDKLKVNQIYPKAIAKLSELGIEQKRVRIRIDLPKDMKNITIGTMVDVTINIDNKENVIIIPKDNLYEKNSKNYVTVVEGSNLIEKEIVTGLEDNDNVEVISGLKVDEVILID